LNIAEILARQAQTRPHQAALWDVCNGQDRRTSFAELFEDSSRVAAWFRSRGVAPGDSVLLLHPMSRELYAALIGTFLCGASAMVVDPSAGWAAARRCLRLRPATAIVGSAKVQALALLIPELWRGVQRLNVDGPSWRQALQQAPLPIHPVTPTAEALITFTSGSTGTPKAAVRTHGFLLAQNAALQASLHPSPEKVELTTLPIFVLANLAAGMTSVIPQADLRRVGEVDPAPLLAQIQRLQVTRAVASPAFFSRLAKAIHTPSLLLKEIFTGGGPVFPLDLQRIAQAFPQARCTAVYGSSEAEPIAEIALDQMSPEDLSPASARRGLLTGQPIPSIQLRIVDPQRPTEAPLPQGESGEILVSGAHVLEGYWRGQGDAENKIRIGGQIWHRTGDLGLLDPQGRLWLQGRLSARITDSKGTLDPFPVECAAKSSPQVERAALVAIQGRRTLVIEGNPAGLNETLAWAQLDAIVTMKIPLDKRHQAKVDYTALRKLLS
jgi:olefin beta-lactone synthetase